MTKKHGIHKNDNRENSLHVDHGYNVEDEFLIICKNIHRKLKCPTQGPYTIIQEYRNNTVRVQRGVVSERINIRRYIPYPDPEQFFEGECIIGPILLVPSNNSHKQDE